MLRTFLIFTNTVLTCHAMNQEDAISRCEQGIERATVKDECIQSANTKAVYKEFMAILNKKLRTIRASHTPTEYLDTMSECMTGVNALNWYMANQNGAIVVATATAAPADDNAPSEPVVIQPKASDTSDAKPTEAKPDEGKAPKENPSDTKKTETPSSESDKKPTTPPDSAAKEATAAKTAAKPHKKHKKSPAKPAVKLTTAKSAE